MGGAAPKLDSQSADRFREELGKYGYDQFVVHCPYFVNFGSAEPRIFHGSSAVVRQELERASLLGASYVMTHLGSAKALGQKQAFEQTKQGLVKVLTGYEGSAKFLLEIAAGAGEIIGDTFEEIAELMEPLAKFKTFGGVCFDTQHAFSSGYDLRTPKAVAATFAQFDKAIGLKWLIMSHMNDSKIDLAGRKDRHEHIGQGKIGIDGFEAIIRYLSKNYPAGKARSSSSQKGKNNTDASGSFALILETEHDTVKADIEMLKQLRDKI